MAFAYDNPSLRPTFVPLPLPSRGWFLRMMSSLMGALAGKPAPAPWSRNHGSNLKAVDESYVPDGHREPNEPPALKMEPPITAEMLNDPLEEMRLIFKKMNYGQYRDYCEKTKSDMTKVWAWVEPKTIDVAAEETP